jgi:hypothetical protein
VLEYSSTTKGKLWTPSVTLDEQLWFLSDVDVEMTEADRLEDSRGDGNYDNYDDDEDDDDKDEDDDDDDDEDDDGDNDSDASSDLSPLPSEDSSEGDGEDPFLQQFQEVQKRIALISKYAGEAQQDDLDRPGVSVEAKDVGFERTGVTHLVHAWHAQGRHGTKVGGS